MNLPRIYHAEIVQFSTKDWQSDRLCPTRLSSFRRCQQASSCTVLRPDPDRVRVRLFRDRRRSRKILLGIFAALSRSYMVRTSRGQATPGARSGDVTIIPWTGRTGSTTTAYPQTSPFTANLCGRTSGSMIHHRQAYNTGALQRVVGSCFAFSRWLKLTEPIDGIRTTGIGQSSLEHRRDLGAPGGLKYDTPLTYFRPGWSSSSMIRRCGRRRDPFCSSLRTPGFVIVISG